MKLLETLGRRDAANPGGGGVEEDLVGGVDEAMDGGAPSRASHVSRREAILAQTYKETGIAKLPAAIEYVLMLLDGGVSKILLFAHHLAVLDGLEEAARSHKIRYLRIDGSVSSVKRALAVKEFQASASDAAPFIAILALTAAGTGLTLTAASTVVFVELNWTPGLMVQAEDRVHRIGQHSACNMHYLLAEDGTDGLMWPVLVKKLKVVAQICDGSVQARHSLKAWTPESQSMRCGDVTVLGAEESLRSLHSQSELQFSRSGMSSLAPPPSGPSLPPPTAAEAHASAAVVADVDRAQKISAEDIGTVPQVDLECPISLEIMHDPVIAMDGFTYEREAIERWFQTSASSPLTNEKLESKLLVPNRRLKAIIASVRERACDSL
jgi:hypothetical protein